jgi:hypothetical protein
MIMDGSATVCPTGCSPYWQRLISAVAPDHARSVVADVISFNIGTIFSNFL